MSEYTGPTDGEQFLSLYEIVLHNQDKYGTCRIALSERLVDVRGKYLGFSKYYYFTSNQLFYQMLFSQLRRDGYILYVKYEHILPHSHLVLFAVKPIKFKLIQAAKHYINRILQIFKAYI